MKDVSILDVNGQPMKPKAHGSYYRGAGGRHPALTNWNPALVSGHAALRYSRERISSRIHDLVRNDGWGSAATTRYTNELIGSGWRLSAKPNVITLGLDPDALDEISDRIEGMWFDYVNDPGFWCDIERSTNMAGLLGLATRHQFADGECVGWIGYREGSLTGFSTAVQVIDPVRLSNPHNRMDTEALKDGVELDGDYGYPVAYHIRGCHPGDHTLLRNDHYRWSRFERETEWGRPVMLHLREKRWAGMTRGEAILAPVVTKLKQITQYDDFELQAASLNALLAAYVTTPLDKDILDDSAADLSGYAQSEIEYYKEQPVELQGVQLAFLHPGSEIKTVKAEHPHSNFESFERNALRNIASTAGMSYEALTADFSQANYSSIRAALVEFRKGFASRATMIGSHWMSQIYRAWLEEVFDKGLIDLPPGVPGFEEAPVAWSHARWVGPGAGWVDPQKEITAAGMRMALGISTLEDEVSAQGDDWRERVDQRARERRYMVKRGLDPDAGRAQMNRQSVADEEEPDERDAREQRENATQKSAARPSVPAIPFGGY